MKLSTINNILRKIDLLLVITRDEGNTFTDITITRASTWDKKWSK